MEILIIIAVIIAAALVSCAIVAVSLSKHTFRCKTCSKSFCTKWTKLIFATHYENEFNIKCPYCKEKGCIADKSE